MTGGPPRFATWILTHWTSVDECVAGDLVEQYHRGGRSSLWYWRQVCSAIAHDAIRDVDAHPVRAALSFGVGLVVMWWGANYILYSLLNLPEWLFVTGLTKGLYARGLTLPQPLREFPMLAGWKALVYAVSGWVVVRTASTPGTSIVFAYLPFVLGFNAITFVNSVGRYPIAQLTIDLLILYPLAAFAGGLVASRARRPIRGVES
jgi:hypothetical protein